eukprot:Gb_16373 [translate_table: standard]
MSTDIISSCKPDTNYANNSKFVSNLNRVLDALVQNTSETGFNTTSYGQSVDKVYVILQCRGDISPSECYNCSQEANAYVRQNCRNDLGGLVWLDLCYLRFENYSFFARLDTTSAPLYKWITRNVTNPDAFAVSLRSFLYGLSAEAPKNDKFFAYGTKDDPSIYAAVQCWRDLSIDDCTACLKTATEKVSQRFDGKAGARALFGSCFIRFETYPFFSVASSLSPEQTSSKSTLAIIFGVIGGTLMLLIVCLFAIRRKIRAVIRCGNPVIIRQEKGPNAEIYEDFSESILGYEHMFFKMETLMAATRNFDKDNKLGEGGFGPVYKGITSDGREIAVKKLSGKSGQGQKEFMNEVKVVAKIQHRNLVKLFGCCAEGRERLLVYEYLSNRSLDKILFDPQRKRVLEWEKRYNIIIGIVLGLLYLHQDSQLRIIHRDIKASNILLDDNLNPKIADFGLGKIFPEGETHVSTRVAGTYGYMAPEYAMQGQLTEKADVYSFGVLLLEIVSGRKNTDFNLSPEMQSLLGLTWRLHKRGHTMDMIDLQLMETCPREQVLKCIHIGLLCTQADAGVRPSMSTINFMFSNNSVRLPDTRKPAFVKSNHKRDSSSSSGRHEIQSDGLSRTSTTSSVSIHSDLIPLHRNDVSYLAQLRNQLTAEFRDILGAREVVRQSFRPIIHYRRRRPRIFQPLRHGSEQAGSSTANQAQGPPQREEDVQSLWTL